MLHNNPGFENPGVNNTYRYCSGSINTGGWNSGSANTGACNSGCGNVGSGNTGHGNVGNRNIGNRNVGDYNSGDYNTGYFNSKNCEGFSIFNQPATRSDWEKAEKPKWLDSVDTHCWVPARKMTLQEIALHPEGYKEHGGYLKVTPLREAWKIGWEKASKEDRQKTFNLPNYDRSVFMEVFGFDPEAVENNSKNLGHMLFVILVDKR